MNWRYIYLFSILLRIYFCLSNSYIHPDEHFQSLEVLSNYILGYDTNIPWEYKYPPSRSLTMLYLIYGPILNFGKFWGLDPLQIWYICRIYLCLVSWVVCDFLLYWLLPIKHERVKAIFFNSTSYVTLVYQSHLFSNSIETILLLGGIYLIDEIRQEPKKKWKCILLGFVISIGVFNRITFPAFLILPGYFIIKQVFYIFFGFIVPTGLFILSDTLLYKKDWVVAPLRNLIYNTNVENLSNHGLHPYYNHLLVNLPQLIGPGIIFLFSKRYIKTTPMLSIISGILFLSFIPHQELRFLIPLVPLMCACFDIKEKFINLWYLFNLTMAVIMGIFHQGGVIPAINFLRGKDCVQVWWNTYTPPTWLLGSKSNEDIIDLMGTNNPDFSSITSNKPIYLITPIASYQKLNKTFPCIWNYTYHIDFDHLSTVLGLGIYEII
ncbi:unnamed protein product [Candida verbasci]|uniref:Mannosyltransferase n=1 Tax=Candida verbasci TaxID=1227364 RepID=A0A9W4TT17_9ASCO|nr:unnamed protein product [Candida verbasci]